MKLHVRMITAEEPSTADEVLIDCFLKLAKVTGEPRIIFVGEYWKMPGHRDVRFDIDDVGEDVDFSAIVDKVGKSPYCINERDVVFATSEGAEISIPGIDWMHVELF